MTFVLEGKIKHYDTLIDNWIELKKGDIQLIQSGSGISHSEFMQKESSIFQIWFDPDLSKTLYQNPKYQDYSSSDFKMSNNVKMLVGEMDLKKGFYYSIYLIRGNASINDKKINENDFVRIFSNEFIKFSVKEKSSFFIVSSPINTSYKTYI